MPPRKLTAEDIKDWPTPGRATELLNDAYGDKADKNGFIARRTAGPAEARLRLSPSGVGAQVTVVSSL